MNSYLIPSGIRFNDYMFSEPRRLLEPGRPKCGGLLVILATDPSWAPKPFQPLCFREFGNNSQETLPDCTPMRLTRTGLDSLFVSYLPMPFSSTEQRCAIRNQLVWAYNPVFQTSRYPAVQNELAYKLDELEKKHEDQTMQLRLLLTSINRLFEPQPAPPRRPIGFLTEPVSMVENER